MSRDYRFSAINLGAHIAHLNLKCRNLFMERKKRQSESAYRFIIHHNSANTFLYESAKTDFLIDEFMLEIVTNERNQVQIYWRSFFQTPSLIDQEMSSARSLSIGRMRAAGSRSRNNGTAMRIERWNGTSSEVVRGSNGG